MKLLSEGEFLSVPLSWTHLLSFLSLNSEETQARHQVRHRQAREIGPKDRWELLWGHILKILQSEGFISSLASGWAITMHSTCETCCIYLLSSHANFPIIALDCSDSTAVYCRLSSPWLPNSSPSLYCSLFLRLLYLHGCSYVLFLRPSFPLLPKVQFSRVFHDSVICLHFSVHTLKSLVTFTFNSQQIWWLWVIFFFPGEIRTNSYLSWTGHQWQTNETSLFKCGFMNQRVY